MIIKIVRDRFWVKASNIERWAEILKLLPEKIPCSSKKDIARDYLGYKVDEKGRIVNADEVYGLFGIEKAKDSVTIVGCNFIRANEEGYELTESAIELVERYKQNDGWEKILAKQLLKYSIRVRSIAFALLNGGYLCFEKRYMENLANAYITLNDKEYYIFRDKPEDVNINTLMNDYSSKILGGFWRKELDIDDAEEIVFKGVNKEYPSLGSMSTYLKIPVLLFGYLGWIIENGDRRYVLDKHKIKNDADKEVYDSLVYQTDTEEIEVLKELIKEYSDIRGFFPIGIVGSMLKNRIDRESNATEEQWIDHYFITGINEGRFKIKDHEQGQPRHGRGLLGKKDYQLIKLEILEIRD
ncbi:hypothetical protein Desca_0287 [Desulfotomaculum nigrificans CO-1-SRB]|uniref:Uncharacterized protein n=1 Tax=Desulfotomaculum nigrificans (strain DSM 14880 / VKM B-2319 / CO-1-SRB) TaxID=868595 RepID=F6B6C0_DESCC|nr:hypothetical protein [Desulfotomaculum nigrificans]AEF93191.1 hypothetical protein Desca_0287 [Desulfotomaculum nigrificans CO-1-SRB]